MRREPAHGLVQHLPVIFPGLMLTIFFIVPFGTMVVVSFFRRQPGGFYVPDFVLANYARFLTPFFGNVLVFSLYLAVAVAVVALVVALLLNQRLLLAEPGLVVGQQGVKVCPLRPHGLFQLRGIEPAHALPARRVIRVRVLIN